MWFYVPVDTKYAISETLPQASLLSLYGKETKPNTTKARTHQSKEMYHNTKQTQKLKPCLVAFYDIRPGNGAGLFSKEKISKLGDK